MVSSIGKKSTTELLRDLRKYKEFDSYLKHDADFLQQTVFTEKLKNLLNRDDRTRIEIAQEACISEIYLYQICTGKRVPSRERVLCLCLVLHPKLEEVRKSCCAAAAMHRFIRGTGGTRRSFTRFCTAVRCIRPTTP